jgi:arylsulfatase A-like enzyme
MSIVDEGVGRVISALEETGQIEDTLVIYTSDHGMSLGEHGFWGHGEDTWPSNTHREANNIPLIIKAPGAVEVGRVDDRLVGTMDIFATVMDYVGVEIPSDSRRPARSLRPLIEKRSPDWRNAVFMEQEETRAIRTQEWLFMKRFEPTSFNFKNELYDLTRDPDERKNLAEDPAFQETVEMLSNRISDFFDTHSAARWNLWEGGIVKSNSTRPFLWKEVWGEEWAPGF